MSYLKQERYLSYREATWEASPGGVPQNHSVLTLFNVSCTLPSDYMMRSMLFNLKNSILQTEIQPLSESYLFCASYLSRYLSHTFPRYTLLNLHAEILGFLQDVHLYGRIFGGQRRNGREVFCWKNGFLGRTWRLDNVMAVINLVGCEGLNCLEV